MDTRIWILFIGIAFMIGMLSGVFSCCLMVASGRYHEKEEEMNIGKAEDESQG